MGEGVMGDQYVRFARHHEVEQFEKEGWRVAEGTNLSDCHHGDWSVIMEKPLAHPDAKVAAVACLTEACPGEFYLTLGPGDHTCERWLITESQLRLIVRDGVKKLLR
jgi:hypothetical protein